MSTTSLPAADSFYLLKMMMAFAFVLGLIFLSAYLFKRINLLGGKRSGRKKSAIQLLATTSLGDKKFLAVVQVKEKQFFLGVTTQAITMLAELTGIPAAPEEEKESIPATGFAESLQQYVARADK
jgi:flagellar biosynthetic protein FliO